MGTLPITSNYPLVIAIVWIYQFISFHSKRIFSIVMLVYLSVPENQARYIWIWGHMLTQICWHHLDLQKLNTAEDQVRSKSLTPRSWNIKTAKLQRALAICCGRQRAAKCFVKSTKVKKPQRGHRSDIQSGSLICENASVPTVFRHFPCVFHMFSILLSIISQYFPYCVPSFPYVPYAFHHVMSQCVPYGFPQNLNIQTGNITAKKWHHQNWRIAPLAPHLDVDEWLAPMFGPLPVAPSHFRMTGWCSPGYPHGYTLDTSKSIVHMVVVWTLRMMFCDLGRCQSYGS